MKKKSTFQDTRTIYHMPTIILKHLACPENLSLKNYTLKPHPPPVYSAQYFVFIYRSLIIMGIDFI